MMRSVWWLCLLIVFSNSKTYVHSLYCVTEMLYACITIFLISSRRLIPITAVINGVWCRVGQYVRCIPPFPVHIHLMTQSIHILSFPTSSWSESQMCNITQYLLCWQNTQLYVSNRGPSNKLDCPLQFALQPAKTIEGSAVPRRHTGFMDATQAQSSGTFI